MEYRERKEVTPEAAVILWQASRLDLSEDYERAPEILKVHGSVIGTLGNFSASIGKAKSKKTFNVSAIVAAALKNGTVLSYTASDLRRNCPKTGGKYSMWIPNKVPTTVRKWQKEYCAWRDCRQAGTIKTLNSLS